MYMQNNYAMNNYNQLSNNNVYRNLQMQNMMGQNTMTQQTIPMQQNMINQQIMMQPTPTQLPKKSICDFNFLPDLPLAQAFVPYQAYDGLIPLETGFKRGSMFPNLYVPLHNEGVK